MLYAIKDILTKKTLLVCTQEELEEKLRSFKQQTIAIPHNVESIQW